MIGAPEISTDGYTPYQTAIRDAFNGKAHHGVVVKTYSVTNLAVKDAARRYSPAEVVAVEHQVVSGFPVRISTSYVERQNLTLRMTQRRFARLTNGFSKKLANHAAAVSLYETFDNLTQHLKMSVRQLEVAILELTARSGCLSWINAINPKPPWLKVAGWMTIYRRNHLSARGGEASNDLPRGWRAVTALTSHRVRMCPRGASNLLEAMILRDDRSRPAPKGRPAGGLF